ncbi:hypothetical protein D3C78_1617000 [compost metagenome]
MPPCSAVMACTVSACSCTPAGLPWNSNTNSGVSRKVSLLYWLTERTLAASMNSTRAIGTPIWMISITLWTASSSVGKLHTAADTASGCGYRRTVTSVMMPSVPSLPMKMRVRS